MISGLAKSEVMPREQQVFATVMTSFDEPVEIPQVETPKVVYTSNKKFAKKNRTTE